MKLPGTVPPNVQNVYVTPSEIDISFSMTSSSTITFAGAVRPVAGGTCGGLVSTALTGAPCGGPKSPLLEPPVVPVVAGTMGCAAAVVAVGARLQPATARSVESSNSV